LPVTCCLPPFTSERFLTALNQLFDRGLRHRTFSGASLLVAKPDQIRFHETWGYDRLRGKSIDGHTLFDLASLTKALITAPLCMYAIAQGKLALDATLDKFHPAGLLGTKKKAITIRHLLCHSSGMPAYEPFYRKLIAVDASRRQDALLMQVLHMPLRSPPGTASCYSDLGFMLLTATLETIYGKPFDHLASQFLLEPLQLDLSRPGTDSRTSAKPHISPSIPSSLLPAPCSSLPDPRPQPSQALRKKSPSAALGFCRLSVPTNPTLPARRLLPLRRVFAATEYCPWRRRLLIGEVHDENAYCLGGVAGHAGLFGTAHGVYRLLVFLWNVHRGSIGHPCWKADVVREFWTKQAAVSASTWMLGFDTPAAQGSSAGNYFSPHSPGHLGFTGTSFWFDLDQEILIILLTNRVYPTRENERLKSFRPLVHNLVMEAYHGAGKD
jgi:serine-type D-Ala-D-Ala carboxypeptidase